MALFLEGLLYTKRCPVRRCFQDKKLGYPEKLLLNIIYILSMTSFYQRMVGKRVSFARRAPRTLSLFMMLTWDLFSWILVVSGYSFLLFLHLFCCARPLLSSKMLLLAIPMPFLFISCSLVSVGQLFKLVSLSTVVMLFTHQWSPISSFVMIIPVYYYFR